MEPMVKTKNVTRIEAILRLIIGAILILFSFFIQGLLRWIVGIMGIAFILTAGLGY